jgi:hypothetical protein
MIILVVEVGEMVEGFVFLRRDFWRCFLWRSVDGDNLSKEYGD